MSKAMDTFVIKGGQRLAGSIMTEGACRFDNIPLLRDIQTQVKILNTLGIESHWKGREIHTQVKDTYNSTAPYELDVDLAALPVALDAQGVEDLDLGLD